MAKYEYQVVSVEAHDHDALGKQLTSYGAEGWEVVVVLPLAGTDHIVYLKRNWKDR